jgi:hypothetical protein
MVFLGWGAGVSVAQRRGDFKLQLVNKCERVVIIDSRMQRTWPMYIVATRSLAGTTAQPRRVQHSKLNDIGSRSDSTI